jgi:membrane fusion protein, multidrug efflux system
VLGKLSGTKSLSVEAFNRDDSTKIADGKLLTIDNQIDPTTGTYKLKAVFENDRNILFPNQFVNIHMLVDIKHNTIIVPSAAIQRGPQGSYVYVVSNANHVNIRPVTVSETTGNNVAISAGLNNGESVVIDGADKLQDGTEVTIGTMPAAPNGSGNPQPQSAQQNAQPGGQSGQAMTPASKPIATPPANPNPAAASSARGATGQSATPANPSGASHP